MNEVAGRTGKERDDRGRGSQERARERPTRIEGRTSRRKRVTSDEKHAGEADLGTKHSALKRKACDD